jgi:hypothetical protein
MVVDSSRRILRPHDPHRTLLLWNDLKFHFLRQGWFRGIQTQTN